MAHLSMAVANEFLKKPGAIDHLTQMQLLKLTYIAHGWNLAVNGAPLITEPVEAWNYGPVVRDLYNHIRFYGTDPITRPIADTDSSAYVFFKDSKPKKATFYEEPFSEAEADVIERVWKRYGRSSGYSLSMLTHKPGTPWFQTFFAEGPSKVIPNDVIRAHYVELANSIV
jgi:uncharacterized phage-associated protein